VIGGMAALGSLAGGWFGTNLSWRWAFYINLPIGALALAGAFLFVDESRDPDARPGYDLPGASCNARRVSALVYRERPAAVEAAGLLVLHHGRGSDETDLLSLADALDPEQRLHVITPRAPLILPGGPGYHWYLVPRVGYPDPSTFHAAYAQLAELHDELWQRTGFGAETTVLGGFSMGTVMSYALGLGPDRPAPAGIVAFSGFVPIVEGWRPVRGRQTRAFVAHGRNDPIIEVDFGRRAVELLRAGGLDVAHHESDAAHRIDPEHIPVAVDWLRTTLPG
jgi:phospholipase/carboxylesterase